MLNQAIQIGIIAVGIIGIAIVIYKVWTDKEF
jgi:hypothetical protein